MTARSNMMRLFHAYCSQQIYIISWLFKFEDNKRSRIRAIDFETHFAWKDIGPRG